MNKPLKDNKLDYEIIEYYKKHRKINLDLYSRLIILGCPMSANDDIHFNKKERFYDNCHS